MAQHEYESNTVSEHLANPSNHITLAHNSSYKNTKMKQIVNGVLKLTNKSITDISIMKTFKIEEYKKIVPWNETKVAMIDYL